MSSFSVIIACFETDAARNLLLESLVELGMLTTEYVIIFGETQGTAFGKQACKKKKKKNRWKRVWYVGSTCVAY